MTNPVPKLFVDLPLAEVVVLGDVAEGLEPLLDLFALLIRLDAQFLGAQLPGFYLCGHL